ncbi:hypothetical protein [Chryseobacterium sp. JM1]|uniref:hypothetical protein n=1 Tax=Chryseobacterium sp. JM1 TaxID=1233950 RepID=UPI0004E7499A|nr:hypothetical protein [Chryseobacterium sp. JM1]KFF19170.1 hypothetical protein IW22_15990 [Chryseobacterium sp. JM1]
MKQKYFLFLFCSLITVSCMADKEDLIGRYSYHSNQLTDSLILKDDLYIHKIFNKDSLMYEGSGNWNLHANRITLMGFYNNENDPMEEPLSNEAAEKFLMRASCPVYKQGKEITIEINADEGIEYKKEAEKE